jgi:predicted RND superfamily exporter protein
MSGERDDFKQLINTDEDKAHILVKLSEPEYQVIQTVRSTTETYKNNISAKVTTGGYALIMADFASSIIKGQVYSLVFALVTVFILVAFVFRSFTGGLFGSIPLAVSIALLFGIMGFTGIALDSATAILSSVMIGVGVDFTIQYLWYFARELRLSGDYSLAAVSSLSGIGSRILINGLSVIAGFSALLFSGFTSIRFFGWLTIISIGSCLAGALIIIPSLLVVFRPKFIEKLSKQIKL